MPSRIRPGYEVSARLGPYVLEQIGDKNGVPSTFDSSLAWRLEGTVGVHQFYDRREAAVG